ncbi:MAG: protein kinase domain-containing protein [Acidimicrobiia bacterium]
MSRMTESGRVLGGRYRLLSPLGSGSSAQVYLAQDERLRRRVAVKVLHPALAADETFLRRFRAEAQAAAALTHPNILAVYDWSGEESTPFLVTEYLSGGSLRSMLDAGHRLSTSQALVVGLEAARALDHAHRQGFVHRDVKPANLLFGDDARLRVGDFGLARVIAEAGLTETGTVLGTARYASPEQARGEAVDGRSDVYSLALLLIEAVTGEVPFSADTTIGTLMARLDRDLVVPEALGPLRPLIEAAGDPDPARRPDAGALASGLVAAASGLTRPEPLPLTPVASPDVDAAGGGDATVMAAAVAGAPPAPGVDDTRVMSLGPPGPPGAHVSGAGSGGAGVSPRDDRARRILLMGAGLVLAVALGVIGAWAYLRSSTPSYAVPAALIGAQRDEAIDSIGEYGWQLSIEELREDGTEPGQVVRTDPEPGTQLRQGDRLTLFVSLGPTLVDVPDGLAGLEQGEAEARLREAGLTAEIVEEESEEVDEGVVIRVGDDVPREVPKGSPVRLVVSAGPPGIEIPDLLGDTFDDVRDVLRDMGLRPDRRRLPGSSGDDDERDRVVRMEPGVGETAEPGSRVLVYVGGGGDGTVEVPDLDGDSIDDAQEKLEDAGLRRGRVFGDQDGEVFRTEPSRGDEVEVGTEVDLYVS